MKYRKILLAYNGSNEGKRALLECAELANFLGAETHLLAVASMPPSLFLTEGFVPEELLEEEKKRTQTVLDEGLNLLLSVQLFEVSQHLDQAGKVDVFRFISDQKAQLEKATA